jgi:predicted naringenin-chalcone synthase
MKVSDINHFAIHPGGKKILEAIESELGISKELNRPAYSVLSQYGNMSSVTIVFVLYHILKQLTSSDDQGTILSMAFGPGLTLESMLLKIYFHA